MQLIKRQDTYRVESEEEAIAVQEEFKRNQAVEGYQLLDSGYKYKCKKAKGEIVDEYWLVTVKQEFNSEV